MKVPSSLKAKVQIPVLECQVWELRQGSEQECQHTEWSEVGRVETEGKIGEVRWNEEPLGSWSPWSQHMARSTCWAAALLDSCRRAALRARLSHQPGCLLLCFIDPAGY